MQAYPLACPDVVYLTKVRIFKQITTGLAYLPKTDMMLFTLQRYEFLSKSQPQPLNILNISDVVYLTKVRIFKQITTLCSYSYTFIGCCLPYKGTNF